MRMGLDERDSVLDAGGASRWVRGLFVADNSALANALGGPNPTLTTQAVATRTAEHIFQRHFGGDPWVTSEAPVSSIDDAVTAAVLAQASGAAVPAALRRGLGAAAPVPAPLAAPRRGRPARGGAPVVTAVAAEGEAPSKLGPAAVAGAALGAAVGAMVQLRDRRAVER